MANRFDFILFLIIVTAASILWGRINRIGYNNLITSVVYFIMKYSRTNTELIRSYLVWSIYMLLGLIASVALLLTYRVNLLRFLPLDTRYFMVVPLAFIAQNSLTGLLMQLLVLVKGTNVYLEVTRIPWVSYTLMMPDIMRVGSPLGAAIVEEVFFRGAVFLVLINKFPQTGVYLPILVCTALFVLQQVLQTDSFVQALILLIGSTSISTVGCITILYTGSFLPTLLCHAAYAFFYLRLAPSMPKGTPKSQRSKPSSAYPDF